MCIRDRLILDRVKKLYIVPSNGASGYEVKTRVNKLFTINIKSVHDNNTKSENEKYLSIYK